MPELASRPYWTLSFDEDGTLTGSADTFLKEVKSSGVRDLFILSHGWNTGPEDADDLYGDLLPRVVEATQALPMLGPVGLVGIHWPAVWFPDRPGPEGEAGPTGGDEQSTQDRPADRGSGDSQFSGREIAETFGRSFDDDRRAVVEQLGKLIDEGLAAAMTSAESDTKQRQRLREFHELLRQLVPDADQLATEDRGEYKLLLSPEPEQDYQTIATQFGDVPAGGTAQSATDVFRKVWKGAKDALRIASYGIMKERAGTVGKNGLGPLLARLPSLGDPESVRVHLAGHSFGARLVSFALAGIPSADESPVASLVLVQAAFSHYSFSSPKDNPFEADGALRQMVDRVHGPLVATYSKYDRAVGTWYPKASALARQDNQANPAVSRWGALGADGFQAVTPLAPGNLLDSGASYQLARGNFYGIDGSTVIKNVSRSWFAGAHSDIRHPEVAWLIAAAAEPTA